MRTLFLLFLSVLSVQGAMFDWGGSRPNELLGAAMHIDASVLTATNGQKIAEMADLSGNDNFLWQTNSTYQPSYTNNLINGRAGLWFGNTSATRRWMQGATNVTASPENGVTIFFFGNASPGTTIQFFFDSRTGSRMTSWVNWPTASTVTLWAGDAAGGGNGASRSFNGLHQLFTMEYSASSGVAYTNGVSGTVVATGTNSLNGLILCSTQATTSLGVSVVGEVVLVRRLLGPSEKERLRVYFQRWN